MPEVGACLSQRQMCSAAAAPALLYRLHPCSRTFSAFASFLAVRRRQISKLHA